MEKTKRILKLSVAWPIIIVAFALVFVFGTLIFTVCGGAFFVKEVAADVKWEKYKFSNREYAQATAEEESPTSENDEA